MKVQKFAPERLGESLIQETEILVHTGVNTHGLMEIDGRVLFWGMRWGERWGIVFIVISEQRVGVYADETSGNVQHLFLLF